MVGGGARPGGDDLPAARYDARLRLAQARRGRRTRPTARRHAEHFRALFARAAAEWETEPTRQWLDAWRGQIGNLRAALDWAFGPSGDAGIGVDLTVAAVPLWFQLSLIDECRKRVETRARRRRRQRLDPRRLMQLRAALGWSLMYTARACRETRAAWESALAVGRGPRRRRLSPPRPLGAVGRPHEQRALRRGARARRAFPARSRKACRDSPSDISATVWSARRSISSATRPGPAITSSGCLPATRGRSVAPTPSAFSSTSSSPRASRWRGSFWLQGMSDQALGWSRRTSTTRSRSTTRCRSAMRWRSRLPGRAFCRPARQGRAVHPPAHRAHRERRRDDLAHLFAVLRGRAAFPPRGAGGGPSGCSGPALTNSGRRSSSSTTRLSWAPWPRGSARPANGRGACRDRRGPRPGRPEQRALVPGGTPPNQG